MVITADSGSTKTTWRVSSADGDDFFTTQGINPFHMTVGEMRDIIVGELIAKNGIDCSLVDTVHFYGAGCTKEKSPVLRDLLQMLFPHAEDVAVESDMLGAAKALFGTNEGIACILGTGANSCLYDGDRIIDNISPMGYILGDEGSGAFIGKTFVNLLYKGDNRQYIEVFEKETGLSAPAIIQKVYREAMPNRFLASLCPFIHSHLDEEWIEQMVIDCFRLFFQRNIKHYGRKEMQCSFVGSIAYYFESQLRKAASQEGYSVGVIKKEPLL